MTLPSSIHRVVALVLSLCATGLLSTLTATAQQQYVIKPVVEKKLQQLPAGSLYWRLENFPTLAEAQAAASPTSLAAEVAGKTWLFTLPLKVARRRVAARLLRSGPAANHRI